MFAALHFYFLEGASTRLATSMSDTNKTIRALFQQIDAIAWAMDPAGRLVVEQVEGDALAHRHQSRPSEPMACEMKNARRRMCHVSA